MPELGYWNDVLGRSKRREPIGADDDASDKISDDGGQPEPSRDRDAQDGGGKKYEPERQEAEFGVLHDSFRDGAGARPSARFRAGRKLAHTALACARGLL